MTFVWLHNSREDMHSRRHAFARTLRDLARMEMGANSRSGSHVGVVANRAFRFHNAALPRGVRPALRHPHESIA